VATFWTNGSTDSVFVLRLCKRALNASKKSCCNGGAVSVFVRMLSIDLWHCFLHSFLLVAGQFQKWSWSSMGAGHEGHIGGYLGLYLWTQWPRGSISLRYLTMVSLRLSCRRKARPWAAQSISLISSSLQQYFNFNFSFRGGTNLANLSSLLMSWVIVP
jgi:hypothetical protein